VPLLYYWRPDNYRRDRAFGFGYHLNQNSPAMAGARPGDSLWAFTRRTRGGVYVLTAELIVRALTRNPPHYRYGTFRLWGDLERSRYFDVDIGPNAEPILRQLSISARAQHLGQAFQGHAAVRQLSAADHRILAAASARLPVLERAGIYPEDELEAQLVIGERVEPFVISASRPEYTRRLAYLYATVDVHRARGLVEHLQRLYAGRCQLCLYDPNCVFRPK
jgi:5-methylcytosine-specific restriction enzyme A